MSDANPPQPFNWNLQPRKPEEQEAAAPPPQPPAYPAAPPPPQWAAAPQQPPAPAGYPAAPPPTQPGTAFPTGSYGVAPTAQQPVAPPPPQYQAPQYPPQPPQYQPAPPAYQPPPVPAYQPPPLVSPPAAAASPFEDIATQAYAFDPTTTQSYPFDDSFRGATEVLGSSPVGLPELRDEGLHPHAPSSHSAIDSLFGESQFREYEAGVLPTDGFTASTQLREREPREPLGKSQRVMLWVAGGLVAALALVGLFALGTKLSALIPPPAPVAVATGDPVIVDAQPAPVGPVAAGTYAWSELLGGECIQPFVSAWQEEYTVVDCATPHTAQLVYHGYFDDEAFAPYPGEAQLQSRINLLCTSPVSVDYAAASTYSDIQVAASYALSPAEWDAGQRDYYCFVSRSSGEAFPASVAHVVVASETLAPTIPSNDP